MSESNFQTHPNGLSPLYNIFPDIPYVTKGRFIPKLTNLLHIVFPKVYLTKKRFFCKASRNITLHLMYTKNKIKNISFSLKSQTNI